MKGRTSYEVNTLRPGDSFSEWDRFVDDSPQGCIFCRSWWLKAVCPNGFEILTLRKAGRIVAGIPLPAYRKWGYTIIGTPQLTQTLGVLLLPSVKTTYMDRFSDEVEVLETLVKAIPKFSYFSVRFNYNFTNWLPFYWAGYHDTTRYTYVIKDLTDLNKVFSDFAYSKRKNIKKAEQLVTIHNDLPAKEFYANQAMTLRKQGDTISYKYGLFKRVYDAALENSAGRVWYAIDGQENIHAAIFVVFDKKSAYYLISSIDPDYRNSGAATLLVREAITYVSQYTKRFDFEGSMIRNVEHSFRKFGAVQTPYFNITKDNRHLLVKTGLRIFGNKRGTLLPKFG